MTIVYQWLSDEEVAWLLFNAAKGKHVQRNLDFSLDYMDVLKEVRRGTCAATGLPLVNVRTERFERTHPFRASLDRIDNSRGYTPDNVRVVSKIFNTAKFCWTDADVMKMAEAFVKRNDAAMARVLDEYLGRQGELPL